MRTAILVSSRERLGETELLRICASDPLILSLPITGMTMRTRLELPTSSVQNLSNGECDFRQIRYTESPAIATKRRQRIPAMIRKCVTGRVEGDWVS